MATLPLGCHLSLILAALVVMVRSIRKKLPLVLNIGFGLQNMTCRCKDVHRQTETARRPDGHAVQCVWDCSLGCSRREVRLVEA